MLWTEFSWNAATCLNELHRGRAFLFPDGAGRFSGQGCPKGIHSLKALSHLQSGLASLTFLHLDIFPVFVFDSLSPACASFPKNTAHCFLFSCCSASLFLPDSHNRMHCIVFIKRLASLVQRNYKCRRDTSCCQACTMLYAFKTSGESLQITFFPRPHGVRRASFALRMLSQAQKWISPSSPLL